MQTAVTHGRFSSCYAGCEETIFPHRKCRRFPSRRTFLSSAGQAENSQAPPRKGAAAMARRPAPRCKTSCRLKPRGRSLPLQNSTIGRRGKERSPHMPSPFGTISETCLYAPDGLKSRAMRRAASPVGCEPQLLRRPLNLLFRHQPCDRRSILWGSRLSCIGARIYKN